MLQDEQKINRSLTGCIAPLNKVMVQFSEVLRVAILIQISSVAREAWYDFHVAAN